jgi:hypothetical protein
MGLVGGQTIDPHHAFFHKPRAFRPRFAEARTPEPGIQPLIITPFRLRRHRDRLSLS